MKDKSVYIGGIVGAVILLIGLYIGYCEIRQEVIVLTITALIIGYYTYETYKMRQELTRIQSTPFLSIFIELFDPDIGTPRHRCCARNDGQITAIDVEFEMLEPVGGGTLIFEKIPALSKDDKKELTVKIKMGNGELREGSTAFDDFYRTNMIFDPNEVPCKLSFRNILFIPHHAEMVYQNGRFLIKKFVSGG